MSKSTYARTLPRDCMSESEATGRGGLRVRVVVSEEGLLEC